MEKNKTSSSTGWGQALSEHEGVPLAGLLGGLCGGTGSLAGDGHVAVLERPGQTSPWRQVLNSSRSRKLHCLGRLWAWIQYLARSFSTEMFSSWNFRLQEWLVHLVKHILKLQPCQMSCNGTNVHRNRTTHTPLPNKTRRAHTGQPEF